MRKTAALLIGSLLLAGVPAMASTPEGEAKLAKALEGRVAGEPVDCINLRNVRSSKVIRDTAIIYDAGSTLYVNRPDAGAESLGKWDVLVTRTLSSQLCNVDVVHLRDRSTGMQTGFVLLGDFIPYRRAE
ncbi:hypothetical protein [Sphingosinicella humi]|uniref:Uncharacterized protein n=1 Tax=Allosphingosinicella humi TaxID=2068657 RepID=A0A2U2J434_9SPHN|nr:hypothetical protein [Sphingosinicella humi]PWG03103.1 hypothetical protein DF286_09680 [Sphingosinicella humi]